MKPFPFSVIRSTFVSFKESFLYYPVLFAVGGVALFLMTSRLDEIYGSSFYDDNNVIVSYLEPIFFAGSPHAARSVLSTIAAGWATILGVAFSVTLITLQLSVTKYTAEIVNEFQNSRISQITLGMFIFVVIFSLLVLKTVRTGEDGPSAFVPILGVNISVYLAVIVLFVFVVFLHNISSYLKPDSLIDRIVAKILLAMRKYENRVPNRKFSLTLNVDEKSELFAIRSPRQGILRSIDWEKISDHLERHEESKQLEYEQPRLLLEWLSATGDHVEKNEIISKLYRIHDKPASTLKTDNKSIEKLIADGILAGLDIGGARRISSDPHYGVEILRNIALKAISQSDIDIASSCVTGLFRIFYNASNMAKSTGVLFMIPTNSKNKFVATVISGEKDIMEESLAQLSLIFRVSSNSDGSRNSLAEHFAENYVRFSRLFLDHDNISAFEKLTQWYSMQSSRVMQSYTKELRSSIKQRLSQFEKDAKASHSYATDTVRIYLGSLFATET